MDDYSILICPNFSKLQHYFRSTCLKALKMVIENEYAKEGFSNFEEFLSAKKEIPLFHLYRRNCCCGRQSYNTALKKHEWETLFYASGNYCPRGERKECPHKFEAKTISVECLEFSLACFLLRNLCPCIPPAVIDTLRDCRNKVCHSNIERMDDASFKQHWAKAENAVMNICATLAVQCQNEIKQESTRIYDLNPIWIRQLDITSCEIKSHEEDKTFFCPKVFCNILDALRKYKVAVIIGPPGCGKTKLCWETLRTLRSTDGDLSVMNVTDVTNLNSLVNPYKKCVLMLDDCLGTSSLAIASVSEKLTYFNTLYAYGKNGNIQVLMSMRKSLFEICRERLMETKLFNAAEIIDLSTEQFQLSQAERKALLTKHLKTNNIRICQTKQEARDADERCVDQFTINDISCTNPYNFPLLCFLYCTQAKYFKQGVQFFTKPRQTVVEDIDLLRISKEREENCQYATLVYTALAGAAIDENNLKMGLLEEIFSTLHINSENRELALHDAIKSLCHTYLKSVEYKANVFEFLHPTFWESVMLSAGMVFPELVVQNCSRNTLCELVRTRTHTEGEGEIVLKLHRKNYKKLAQRFLQEIISDKQAIKHILSHPSMTDDEVKTLLYQDLRAYITNAVDGKQILENILLESCRCGYKEVAQLCFEYSIAKDLQEKALNVSSYFDHADIVMFIVPYMNISEPSFLQSFLQCCSFGCLNVANVLLPLVNESGMKEGLIRSCKSGKLEILKLIMSKFAGRFDDYIVPMKEAIEVGRTDIVKYLILNYQFSICENGLADLVIHCCYAGCTDLAKYFMQNVSVIELEIGKYIQVEPVSKMNSNIRDILLLKASSCRTLIQLLVDLKDFCTLEEFITLPNIQRVSKLVCSQYLVQEMFRIYPSRFLDISNAKELLLLFMFQGWFDLLSNILDINSNLISTSNRQELIGGKYTLIEFALFCGYREFKRFSYGHEIDDWQHLWDICLDGYVTKRSSKDCQKFFGIEPTINNCMLSQRMANDYLRCLISIRDEMSGKLKCCVADLFRLIENSFQNDDVDIEIMKIMRKADPSLIEEEYNGKLAVQYAVQEGKWNLLTFR